MAKKIYLSPSSQPANVYAVGNTNEQEQCRKIAAKCAEALKRCGFEAKAGLSGTYQSRTKESNTWGADAHIPIHTNGCNGKVAGFRGFYSKAGGEGYKLLSAIAGEVEPITPGKSDGLSVQTGLYEINNSKAPCAYLELGFHDNPEEARYIIEHTDDLAEAICKGVCKHYGVKYVSPSGKPTSTEKPAEKPTGGLYRVSNAAGKQVGAYSVEENAINEVKRQLKSGGSAKITYGAK